MRSESERTCAGYRRRVPKSARSFADDLRQRSDAQLAALLQARPDAARPAPADITTLAARLQTRASVHRALESLDVRQLQVAQALLTVDAADVAGALATTKKAATEGISRLWDLGLAWRAPEGMRLLRAVEEALPNPGRLGPQAAQLEMSAPLALTPQMSADEVTARVDALSPGAQSVLSTLRWSGPRATFDSPKLSAVRDELTAAGFLASLPGNDALMPREVALALRAGRLFETAWEATNFDYPEVDVMHAGAAGAGSVSELMWRLDDIAAFLDTHEPRVLRTGGLSVRDHRRIASAIDAPSDLTAFLLELGLAARWWASDGEIAPTWRPTSRYDDFADASPATRWALVALAWRDMSRAPSLAGQTIDGTLINVLGRDANWPLLRSRRHDVLDALAQLPAGSAPTVSQIDALLRARRPLRLSGSTPTHADVVLREGTWLGVIALGALTDAGRALLTVEVTPGHDPDLRPVIAAIEAATPAPVSQVTLQGDLTAIAPGTLTPEVARLMRRAAVVESRGGATVFRFTEASVRHLLDTGLSGDDAVAALREISLTPLPQPLEYLIQDVARRHGQLRVGSIGSYVRSDDDATLDALLLDTKLGHLQLRRIAPSVIVSRVSASELLEELREHRYAPVAETSDGGVVVHAPSRPRAPLPRNEAAPVTVSRIDADAATALVASLRAGDAAAKPAPTQDGPRIPPSDPVVTLATLQDAAADRLPVWIGYVDALGEVQRGLFRPERVAGGRVTGQLGEPAKTQTFSIHRITGVSRA